MSNLLKAVSKCREGGAKKSSKSLSKGLSRPLCRLAARDLWPSLRHGTPLPDASCSAHTHFIRTHFSIKFFTKTLFDCWQSSIWCHQELRWYEGKGGIAQPCVKWVLSLKEPICGRSYLEISMWKGFDLKLPPPTCGFERRFDLELSVWKGSNLARWGSTSPNRARAGQPLHNNLELTASPLLSCILSLLPWLHHQPHLGSKGI